MEVIQLGNIANQIVSTRENPQRYRVYDIRGIAPTLNCMQGGGLQPFIIVKRKKKKIIVAMRGRNPENPNSRVSGLHTEQRLEVNSKGISNCLTSVSKDNLVLVYD